MFQPSSGWPRPSWWQKSNRESRRDNGVWGQHGGVTGVTEPCSQEYRQEPERAQNHWRVTLSSPCQEDGHGQQQSQRAASHPASGRLCAHK